MTSDGDLDLVRRFCAAGDETGLGGHIVLAASGAEEALAMARTCPYLRHGGSIVVRPVDPT